MTGGRRSRHRDINDEYHQSRLTLLSTIKAATRLLVINNKLSSSNSSSIPSSKSSLLSSSSSSSSHRHHHHHPNHENNDKTNQINISNRPDDIIRQRRPVVSKSIISESIRRRQIGQTLYNLWTANGSDLSGLAMPWIDGRLDVLGRYMTLSDFLRLDDDDDDDAADDDDISIDSIPAHELSYTDFLRRYMIPNVPVKITGLANNGHFFDDWTTSSSSSSSQRSPDVSRLVRDYGDNVVPVHIQHAAGFGWMRPKKSEMTLAEYVDWWNDYHCDLQHKQQNDDDDDDDHSSSAPPTPLYYLKDWKFLTSSSSSPTPYRPFDYFRDDWLDDTFSQSYTFSYLGPAGTVTRGHTDVLNSFSWSGQLCGRKRWRFVPPEATRTFFLYNVFGRRMVPYLPCRRDDDDEEKKDDDDDDEWGPEMRTWYPGSTPENAKRWSVVVMQERGDVMFVPSGWWHTVENVEDSLSVNCNWVNGSNVSWCWNKIRLEMEELTKAQSGEKGLTMVGMEKRTTTTTTTTGGEGREQQVGDDLVLLWMMISKKARDTLQSITCWETDDDDDDDDDFEIEKATAVYNLTAIHPILEGINDIIQKEGCDDFGLSEQLSDCREVMDLFDQVTRALDHLSINDDDVSSSPPS